MQSTLILISPSYTNRLVLTIAAGHVMRRSLMVLVSMSLHLSEISEAPTADITLNSKVITVFSLMLFKISYICGTVLALVTFMHNSGMIFSMAD